MADLNSSEASLRMFLMAVEATLCTTSGLKALASW